jgi:sigma-B regulation protein RsbU (phosphoserine phosphatase)
LLRQGQAQTIEATGLPLGIFGNEHFSVSRFQMQKGDTLFLYTDGLSETRDGEGREYGAERLSSLLIQNAGLGAKALLTTCVQQVDAFRITDFPTDDVTLMAIQRID